MRTWHLDNARRCAAQADASLMPPENTTQEDQLPRTHQGTGATGTAGLLAAVHLSLFPPDQPFIFSELSLASRADRSVDKQQIAFLEENAMLRDLQIHATIESMGMPFGDNRPSRSFNSLMCHLLNAVLVVGDGLCRLDGLTKSGNQLEPLRGRIYRLDQYVTAVDAYGHAIEHSTIEQVDVRALTEAQLEDAQVNLKDYKDKPVEQRLANLVTRCEWQPVTKKWLFEQEVNSKTLESQTENYTHCPYLNPHFRRGSGEAYGRGLVDRNIAELEAVDAFTGAIKDFAHVASYIKFLVRRGESLDIAEMNRQPSGSWHEVDDIQGGQAQGIAALQLNKLADFSVVKDSLFYFRDQLGKQFGQLWETVRQSERTTGYEVQATQQQLDRQHVGLYNDLSDSLQIPLYNIVRSRLEDANVLVTLPEVLRPHMRYNLVAGAAALARRNRVPTMIALAEVLSKFGEDAVSVIEWSAWARTVAKYGGSQDVSYIRSEEDRQKIVDQRRQQESNAAIRQAAGEQVVASTGAVAEQVALSQLVENSPQ